MSSSMSHNPTHLVLSNNGLLEEEEDILLLPVVFS